MSITFNKPPEKSAKEKSDLWLISWSFKEPVPVLLYLGLLKFAYWNCKETKGGKMLKTWCREQKQNQCYEKTKTKKPWQEQNRVEVDSPFCCLLDKSRHCRNKKKSVENTHWRFSISISEIIWWEGRKCVSLLEICRRKHSNPIIIWWFRRTIFDQHQFAMLTL